MSNKDDANSEGTAGLQRNGERGEVRAHCSAPGRGRKSSPGELIGIGAAWEGVKNEINVADRILTALIKTGKLEVAQDNSALDMCNVLAPRRAHEGRHPQGS